jgi:hypothetical protein
MMEDQCAIAWSFLPCLFLFKGRLSSLVAQSFSTCKEQVRFVLGSSVLASVCIRDLSLVQVFAVEEPNCDFDLKKVFPANQFSSLT